MDGGYRMTLHTERLELILLTAHQLELWIHDLPALEQELYATYDAEPLEAELLAIVKKQHEITRDDEGNTVWHSFFFLLRKEDRVVVGSSDFKDIPNERGEVEIGYGLGIRHRRCGYMTEAVKAMCTWAQDQPGVSAVLAETECDNAASQNVLARCGFHMYSEGETLWWRL